tara:strand:+ start:264 stop:662 length:399 start_codon:yes stop_codon:yes gene_type:complete
MSCSSVTIAVSSTSVSVPARYEVFGRVAQDLSHLGVDERRLDDAARIPRAAVAVIGDLDAVIHRPLERGNDVAPRSTASRVQRLKGIEARVGRDADHTEAVGDGGDGTSDMGAVTEVVLRRSGTVNEVGAPA